MINSLGVTPTKTEEDKRLVKRKGAGCGRGDVGQFCFSKSVFESRVGFLGTPNLNSDK